MNRLLPVVLLLVLTTVTPALARKWTARSGGFSIEAELVDVRDGHAVLKKEDGLEVNVPLSKLSLADIRPTVIRSRSYAWHLPCEASSFASDEARPDGHQIDDAGSPGRQSRRWSRVPGRGGRLN